MIVPSPAPPSMISTSVRSRLSPWIECARRQGQYSLTRSVVSVAIVSSLKNASSGSTEPASVAGEAASLPCSRA